MDNNCPKCSSENGYVDYYIEVEDGLIVLDTYAPSNVDKAFNNYYDATLWAK
ncbi:hypothetical protein [Lysinibacillus sphaericus]|uniref:hypothetical protein n=1 Tax=Lysinibacillus sphaericus TaxID=1421 RepID=UPI0018CFC413|nr:hypothetical protein [Lysinibacillus sphaericus]